MKRILAAFLAGCICFGLCGCANGITKMDETEMYTPAKTISTTFGEVTILDAAFCARAEAYITKSTYSSETTINGQTTSSSVQTLVTPGYAYSDPYGILFAVKAEITNRSGSELTLSNIPGSVQFPENEPLYLLKSVNFSVSESGAETLASGSSGQIILLARVPMETYNSADFCVLDLDGVKLKFPYDTIRVLHSLGYEENDNIPISMSQLLNGLGLGAGAEESNTVEALIGYCGSSTSAEGTAITIADVSVSFLDELPAKLYAEYSRIDNGDEHILDESQVYAAVHFRITNHTKEEQLLANLDDGFVVDINYDDGFIYSTSDTTYSYYETKSGSTRASGDSRLGSPVAVPSLSTVEITIYIPCARLVADSDKNPLRVKFHSGFDGYECFDFVIR